MQPINKLPKHDINSYLNACIRNFCESESKYDIYKYISHIHQQPSDWIKRFCISENK